ncbi:MAG: hypothetical protein AB7V48_10200 [Sedimentibacter sp.]
MKLSKDQAFNDVQTIKETLESTKLNFKGFYTILLLYGVLRLALYIIALFTKFIFKNVPGYGFFPFFIDTFISVFILIVFLKVFKSEKDVSNKYYLSCMTTWGIIAVALPFIMLAIRFIIFLFLPSEFTLNAISKLSEFNMLINVVLLILCFIMCSILTNNKWLISISLLILFVFLLLDTFFYNTMKINGTLILYVFYNIATSVGYIILAYLLKGLRMNYGYK